MRPRRPTPLPLRSAHCAGGPTCSYDCTDNCAVCTGATRYTDPITSETSLRITIDVAGCKGSALSWMCCRSSTADGIAPLDCSLVDGSCNNGTAPEDLYELGKNKRNEVTSAVYSVPTNATMLTIQTHDGEHGMCHLDVAAPAVSEVWAGVRGAGHGPRMHRHGPAAGRRSRACTYIWCIRFESIGLSSPGRLPLPTS